MNQNVCLTDRKTLFLFDLNLGTTFKGTVITFETIYLVFFMICPSFLVHGTETFL